MTDNLPDGFINPGPEHRGKPFWSWNGELQKEELFRQIEVMKEMGMGGFFMHARTGLETEYLGDKWFQLINACADHAEKLNMEAWLYDEDRWPSGLAGGIVSQHPEFRQKAIFMEVGKPPKGERELLGQWVAKLEGPACYGLEKYQGHIPAGKTLLSFSVIEQGKSGFYNGYTYIDTMNRGATEAFLKSTHEKYAEHCGDRLGKSIKGIFTDEPHRGALLDGFSMYMEDGEYTLPYTPQLFDAFNDRFGYGLLDHLPELFLQLEGIRMSPVKWHYVELLQQLFIENFAMPCQQWCQDHNLVLTGHVLHEDNLTAQTAMSGSVMRYYEHMCSPGVDVLSEGNRNFWIVKQLSSVARQTGKKQLLSELYGCTGWQMPFKGHKAVGDWQALFGINLRCHHLSWYTMKGEAKRDYPASILHQSAWYKEYKAVEDYFSRFGVLMNEGQAHCDVLVINPVETFWAQVHLGWSKKLALLDEHLQNLEKQYQDVFHWLMEAQVDFDYGDEDMMSRLGKIDGDKIWIGEAAYSHAVVSGMETIRSSTLDLLVKFHAMGGKVVVLGEPPAYLDAQEDSYTSFAMENFIQLPFDRDELLRALPTPLAQASKPEIFGQLRDLDEGQCFATLNMEREQPVESVMIRLKTTDPIVELDCSDGSIRPIEGVLVDCGWSMFKTNYAEGQMRVFRSHPEYAQIERVTPSPSTTKTVSMELKGPFAYELSEPNLCVLDRAEYSINGQAWQACTDILKIDQQVRDSFGIGHRGGEMLQPWFTGLDAIKDLGEVQLRFRFDIGEMPDRLDLVIEDVDQFQIQVNGQALEGSAKGHWIDVGFHRVEIPRSCLQLGENQITMGTRYQNNSNLEAIYLLGEFGVQLDGSRSRLVDLPENLALGDVCQQGLPFYSGGIQYQLDLPQGCQTLSLHAFGGACASLWSMETKGVDKSVMGWAPYQVDTVGMEQAILEVVLTRRNTFGPLHDNVKNRSHNGPDHWLTEGDDYSERPVLIPSGLLEAPTVSCTG